MLSLQLGPVAIPTHLALLYAGLFSALLTGWLVGRKRQANPETALFNMLLLGFVVARLAFVIRYADDYQWNLLAMLDIRDGGFLPLAGLLATLSLAGGYLWRNSTLRMPLASGLAVGAAVGGLGFAMLHALHSSQQLPDVALRDMHGQPVQLQNYLGKPLVINLWATWCPPCRREMPILHEAQQQYLHIEFVFINQGEGRQQVLHYLSEQGLALENLLLDSGARTGQAVSSLSLPTTLFYDANGILRNNHLGELSNASLNHALRTINKELP